MTKPSNEEKFLSAAKISHSDKYDYSLVEYVDAHTKVKIICPTHGIFEQTPAAHKHRHGCVKCGAEYRGTNQLMGLDEFIRRAKNKWGELYDYSLTEFTKIKSKVKIVCSKHGVFEKEAYSFIQGQGCPKCSIESGKSGGSARGTEWFIEKSKLVHGDTYDYSKSKYTYRKDLIEIICKIHGSFFQYAGNHLQGMGCTFCSHDRTRTRCSMTKDEFLLKSHEKHGNRYDYSKVELVNANSIVDIKCNEHGWFKQRAIIHANGHNCPKCAMIELGLKGRKTKEQFIIDATRIHGDKYNYDLSVFDTTQDKIKIYCNQHGGYFYQKVRDHLAGTGCRECGYMYNNFRRNDWVEKYKDRICCFYIIKCFNDNEEFYKYGITSRKVNDRYGGKKSMPYEIEIIREVFGDAGYIFDLEKRFGAYKKGSRYNPLIYFKGCKYECFSNYTQKPLKKTE